MALCSNSAVEQVGRSNFVVGQIWAIASLFARAATFSPSLVVEDVDTGAGIQLTQTLSLAAQGSGVVLTPGILIEVTSPATGVLNNITCELDGVTEAEATYNHPNIRLNQLQWGKSTWVVIGSQELSGNAYPTLLMLRNEFQTVATATAFPLTAAGAPNDATSTTFAGGPPPSAPDREITNVITLAATGALFRTAALVSTSPYFDLPLRKLLARPL
jgi:hypothetical protein